MDVLIVCPTYEDRLFDHTIRSIFSQRGDGGRVDVFFPWQGDQDIPDNRDKIHWKYEQARQRAITGNYDAMLCIESDMIVPPEALPRLAATGADVAYGLYVFRRPPWHWSAYSVLNGMSGYPLSGSPERARLDWGKVVAVDGIGLGCTLIRRHVFDQVPFRADGERHPDGERSHCDWYFALDCVHAGYTQVCDTAITCGHIGTYSRTGDPFAGIVWPDIDGLDLVRFAAF